MAAGFHLELRAHCEILVLPMSAAPASSSLRTTVASADAIRAQAVQAAVVGQPSAPRPAHRPR